MPTVTIPDWGKGLNRDALPLEMQLGYVSDCQNIRFKNGFAQRTGGTTQILTDYSSELVRWIADFSYNAGTNFAGLTRYCIVAGLNQVYADNVSTRYTITRYIEPVAISSVTGAGSVATVNTSTNHGLTTGDLIDTYSFVGSPDVYNVTNVAVTVVNATRFTYPTSASTAGNPPSTIGSYTVASSSATSAFSTGVSHYRWTGGNLNGVFIINNPYEGTYYWNGDNTKKMRRFGFAFPSAAVARPFKYYIVRLKQEKSGVAQKHNVSWTNAAEPGSVPTTATASSTNDAGEVDLAETPGELVDCHPLGDLNIVFKEDCYYAMQYVGGNDVFRFTRIGDDGLLAPNCVVETPKGQVFISKSLDIRIHNGGPSRSIAEGFVRKWIQANVTYSTATTVAWVARHSFRNEVVIALPVGQSYTNKALLWSWDTETWGEMDLPVDCYYGSEGVFPGAIALVGADRRLVIGARGTGAGIGRTLLTEQGTTLNGSTTTHMLERKGLTFGDASRMKTLSDSCPHIDGTAGSVFTISHGTSTTADGTVTYATGATYTLGTSVWANAFTNQGRFAAWKLSTTTTNDFSIKSVDMEFQNGGKF